MIKRRSTMLMVAGAIVLGSLPLGGTQASAAECGSSYRMFFYYGIRVETSGLGLTHPTTGQPIGHQRVGGPPVNIDSEYYSCTLAPSVGLSMNNPVMPGASLVVARDDGSQCVDVGGHVVGLGVQPGIVGSGSPDNGVGIRTASYGSPGSGDHRLWQFPRNALNECDNTTGAIAPGAGSGTLPMDPTALGKISAWTDRGEAPISYYTIDR